MKKWLISMALLAAGSALAASADIKGITPGMSEAEFLKLYPDAECQEANLLNSDRKFRQCDIPDMTLAGQDARQAQVRFLSDKLISMRFVMFESQTVNTALGTKFGAPDSDQNNIQIWLLADGVMLSAGSAGGNTYIEMDTQAHRDLGASSAENAQAAANADL